MFDFIPQTLGGLSAIALFVVIFLGPLLLLIFCYSVARSLHRIADAQEYLASQREFHTHATPPSATETPEQARERIANSAFAR